MKKLFKNFLSVLALGSMVLLYSCGGDDEPVTPDAPTISITSSQFASGVTTYTGTAGMDVNFTVNVNAPGGFNNITVDYLLNNVAQPSLQFTESKSAGTTELTHTSNPPGLVLEEQLVGLAVSIEITVVDDNNLTTSLTLEITVESAAARSYSAILLAAPLTDRTSMTWFSTNLGTRISSADVVSSTSSSADVDFGYAYLTEANLGAPASYPSTVYDLGSTGQNWGTLNATMFKSTTMTSEMFAAANNFTALEAAYVDASGTAVGLIEGLAVGDVISFTTDAGKDGGTKRGLILVKAVNGTFNEGDNIELDIIIQE